LRATLQILGALLLVAVCEARETFTLHDGAISHTDATGTTNVIDVGRKCADLWVAPDESAIAFVAVDSARPSSDQALGYNQEPLPERTSIYVARRSTGFQPVFVTSEPVTIGNRAWYVLRNPCLSPDGDKLYFSIPYTMTTWKIISISIASRQREVLGDASNFCVVWFGEYSGGQLLQSRYLPEDPAAGVSYRCDFRADSGARRKVAGDCSPFEQFAAKWSSEHGGTCRVPLQ
jgi:hypothetical protein